MKKLNYIILALSLILASCGGTGSDPAPEPDKLPVKVLQIFPEKDAVCNQGTTISATQSSVTLRWNSAANTDSYDVAVKNLLTGASTTQSSTQTQLTVTLATNTPYSWAVTSKSAKVTDTAVSDTWKFYNAGPGTVSYAPFPAELLTPTNGQAVTPVNGMVTLTWKGSDVDNDIVSYDVYLSNLPTPALYKSDVTATTLDVNAKPNSYWRVVTKDSKGNTSDSGVFQYTIK
ncbi:hypothetical protein [Mucilaginibacter polytrichastri]|uniref:Fibronectin type-III domain-containing protein n=1 Tax=Mucilaginibacter polytrichastri TaxID=1302689 RepID=A0A1Q5ZV46_9SPHI|nr:hypothetical protein [Mucilaginibacter polytrichastri]OKS85644.1 hypothetical protein RG47T_1090 [Mucilaginibacter polytrichastri]SFS35136.1 hypothetical protein SAMN04487890_10114 [Mucilaginibacter polytrichastri]